MAPGHAELEDTGRLCFGPGDGLAFRAEDIHGIVNASSRLALSLTSGRSYAAAHWEKFDPGHSGEAAARALSAIIHSSRRERC